VARTGGGGAEAGGSDRLERLWTPHRMAYISGGALTTAADLATERGCPFCRAKRGPDEDGLVVARGAAVFAVLNLYPYNPGHLMVLPYRHVADYPDLDPAETVEFAQFSQLAMRVIRSVSAPHGFNLGMNQGAVAGAGIAAHLHQHVVPRWGGDTNFMPVIAGTKTLPQLLADTRALLAEAWTATSNPAARPQPTTSAKPARPQPTTSAKPARPQPARSQARSTGPDQADPTAAPASTSGRRTAPRKAAKATKPPS
jgi:ATP adenylyltransferase